MKTLVTGFTPFDDREVNASWIAACALSAEPDVDTLEIPVVWGEPGRLLTPLCRRSCPQVIISMGEGRGGWFDIETRAGNTRKERPDNRGLAPRGAPIDPAGPATIDASIDARALQRRLRAEGFPVRTSRDAGAYLCEETLYTLERLRGRYAPLITVVFVHLPPYGTLVKSGDRRLPCAEPLLDRFAHALHAAVLAMHAATLASAQETDSLANEIVHNALLKK